MNVQDKLVALHHLDCPWRPSDIEQREGRILRQGNQNEEVEIYKYVTGGSFDAYSYQLIQTKATFINQIMANSNGSGRTAEDLDRDTLTYAEVKALVASNPDIIEKTELDRPEFQRMLEDIKNKKINVIIIKDLSRLGRNYIETGNFIEVIFPAMGVSVISVDENCEIDSSDYYSDDYLPLKNLFNDTYAKDI